MIRFITSCIQIAKDRGLDNERFIRLRLVSNDFNAGDSSSISYTVYVFKNTPVTADKFFGLIYIDSSLATTERKVIIVGRNLVESEADSFSDIVGVEGVTSTSGVNQWANINW